MFRRAGYPESAVPLAAVVTDPVDQIQFEAIAAELNIFLAEQVVANRRGYLSSRSPEPDRSGAYLLERALGAQRAQSGARGSADGAARAPRATTTRSSRSKRCMRSARSVWTRPARCGGKYGAPAARQLAGLVGSSDLGLEDRGRSGDRPSVRAVGWVTMSNPTRRWVNAVIMALNDRDRDAYSSAAMGRAWRPAV